jgi:predicted TPR repeat methyltransferase
LLFPGLCGTSARRHSPVPFPGSIVTRAQLTSGDLIADRRAAYAHMLFEAGDPGAAADLMAQALEIAPDWPAGLDLLGRYREAAGDIAGAVEAWRALAARDTDGMFGATLKLAVHGAALAPRRTEPGYVAALFDTYADDFDAALLQRLHYRVPELVAERVANALDAEGRGVVAQALDLGCGTGLMGERLRQRVSHLSGVDLSPGMIAEARRKGVYDQLAVAELTAFLAECGGPVDLVTAADVFVYCGALPPVFAAIAERLRPGGLLAFSIETDPANRDCVLRSSLRFAHSRQASLDALAAAGFSVVSADVAMLREDRGEPIEGLVVLARRNAPVVVATPAARSEDSQDSTLPQLH